MAGAERSFHFRFPASLFGIIAQSLRDRLTVGHSPLEAGIGVRIPIPQQGMTEKGMSETNTGAEKRELINGSYGFVIKPDSETQQKATNIARLLFPRAEFLSDIPHVTLYHGRVENLPTETVSHILFQLRKNKGKTLNLRQIEIYGSKFAFWNIETTDYLSEMHGQALGIARYLDKNAVQRAVEEGLSMSQDELENVRKFGHPLVRNKFKPHITLAYDSEGLIVPSGKSIEHWEMKIDDVLFAQMGKYGSVAGIVEI